MEDTNNDFDGSFENDCQRKSIPIQLLTVISMLIDGVGMALVNSPSQSLN